MSDWKTQGYSFEFPMERLLGVEVELYMVREKYLLRVKYAHGCNGGGCCLPKSVGLSPSSGGLGSLEMLPQDI